MALKDLKISDIVTPLSPTLLFRSTPNWNNKTKDFWMKTSELGMYLGIVSLGAGGGSAIKVFLCTQQAIGYIDLTHENWLKKAEDL